MSGVMAIKGVLLEGLAGLRPAAAIRRGYSQRPEKGKGAPN
jgi:hypothetical protein